MKVNNLFALTHFHLIPIDSRCTHYKYRAKTVNSVSEFTHSNWITQSYYSNPKQGWQLETCQTTQWWWSILRLTVINLPNNPVMAMNPCLTVRNLPNNLVMVINPMDDCNKLTKQPSDDDQTHGWQQETYQTTQWWWSIPWMTVINLPNNPVMVINPLDDCNKLTKQPSDGDQSPRWL